MNIQGFLGGVEYGLMKAGLVYSWCSYYTMLLLADRLTKANPSPMNIQGRLGGVEYGLIKAGLLYSWCSRCATCGWQTDQPTYQGSPLSPDTRDSANLLRQQHCIAG